jgi:AcrR family transcriptional regulator
MNADGTVVEGPWHRRRRILQREIEAVGLRLFARIGYENVTVEQIATAANISVRTYFRYFPSKDGVLLALPQRTIDDLCSAVVARPPGEAILASWRAVAMDPATFAREDVELSALLREIRRRSPEIEQRIYGDPLHAERIANTVARQLNVDPVADPRPAVVGAIIRATLLAALVRWSKSDDGRPVSELFAEAFDILEHSAQIHSTASSSAHPRARRKSPSSGKLSK